MKGVMAPGNWVPVKIKCVSDCQLVDFICFLVLRSLVTFAGPSCYHRLDVR